jgi:5-methylcytosine-specific restriction protein B
MAVQRTKERVRHLDADTLGVGASSAIKAHGSNRPDDPPLSDSDPRLAEVRELLKTYGGVIFSGPPGTSKSWFANKIGTALAESEDRVVYVQFHPSYQYEDFIQGFVPKQSGDGFEMKPKTFLRMCRDAAQDPDHTYVVVIDELSRADPGRVFGEALTYVEHSKRGLSFRLASGETATVPPNVVVLATMNPLDRGVDEVDAAFERRFAKIAMEPDAGILADILDSNGVQDPLRRRLLAFLGKVNGQAKKNPLAAVGHTFFLDVEDEASLQRVWNHQLRFLFEKAHRLDPDGFAEVEADWNRMFAPATDEDEGAPSGPAATAGVGQQSAEQQAGTQPLEPAGEEPVHDQQAGAEPLGPPAE